MSTEHDTPRAREVEATAGRAAAVSAPEKPGRQRLEGGRLIVVLFLGPALLLLAVLVVYPIFYTVVRSFYSARGFGDFVGLDNYVEMFTSARTLTAIRNNAIWVLVAPTIVTILGLFFAVLTERVSWSTAFKVIIFMPMAISFLAAGVIFRLVYEADPDRGLANAIIVGVHDIFNPSSAYPDARPRDPAALVADGGALQTADTYATGDVALLPLVGIAPEYLPDDAEPASEPAAGGALSGVVWFDFTRGGGGTEGEIDGTENGLPGVEVQALRDGQVVATTETDAAGRFVFDDIEVGDYTIRLPASNFTTPFAGFSWLGPTLVTPAVISSYLWIWAGFAMVLIAAGLAAIPRDALEAARVDGATEWQVFRRVTVPLISPVLLVVIVTLMINVLKIFDLVLVLAPESVQDNANVIALELWRVSFGGGRDQGLGSALGVLLFILVLPAMLFNIRRFRREQQ